MMVANGLLTTRGGLVSHAAVVARGWGTPAVVGAEAIVIGDGSVSPELEDKARLAVANCPEYAITITEGG